VTRPQEGPRTRAGLATDLRRLGLGTGDVVLVHSSLSRLGFVVGGAPTVLRALLDVVGGRGTLVVPAMTPDNSDPSRWADTCRTPVPTAWWPEIRENLPAFDAERTPAPRMGAVAEVVRTWPGARRSRHPQSSFAAVGALADDLTDGHALDCHFGDASPLGKLSALGVSRALLLGVGYEACTAFHLGEYQWPGNTRRSYECVIQDGGGRRWVRYEDVTLDDGDFGRIGDAFEAGDATGRIARGFVGSAPTRLFGVADAADHATTWMATHRRAGGRAGIPAQPSTRRSGETAQR
jgi:aminoglycoside 3-N-acetyltransferase